MFVHRKKIDRVTFSLSSTREIVANSVLEVTCDGVWAAGKPVPKGLLDPALGAISSSIPCKTCGGQMVSKAVQMHLSETVKDPSCFECPGHFGHFSLPFPIFTRATIEPAFQLLSSFCAFCGEFLLLDTRKLDRVIAETKSAANDMDRLRIIYNAAKGTPFCRAGCKRTQPLFSMVRGKNRGIGSGSGAWFPITATFPEEDHKDADPSPNGVLGMTLPVSPLRAEFVLSRVKHAVLASSCSMFSGKADAAREFLSSLTLRAIPVPPPCIRPTEFAGSGATSKAILHSMTQKLLHIIRAARSLRASIAMADAPMSLTSFTQMSYSIRRTYDAYTALQFLVDWLHYAEHAGPPPPSVPKTLYQSPQISKFSIAGSLNGKGGRVRNNLMGKRDDFTIRAVISPDPNVGHDCVAIPRKTADVVTIPERVTPLNRHILEKEAGLCIQAHGSTRSIFSVLGESRRDLTSHPYDPLRHGRLAIGQTVERRLQDGDIVILNRQPTLHGPSMQAVRVIIQDRMSIAFGLSKTTPFNADFDGDEMVRSGAHSQYAAALTFLCLY